MTETDLKIHRYAAIRQQELIQEATHWRLEQQARPGLRTRLAVWLHQLAYRLDPRLYDWPGSSTQLQSRPEAC